MPFPLEIELDLSLAQMEHHVATYNGYIALNSSCHMFVYFISALLILYLLNQT